MRPAPTALPPAVDPRPDPSVVTQTRRYQLMTPLFGGGVEAGVTDLVTPIRGSTIRGQLRFWWRASRGGRFSGDLKKMKDAEDLLWGAASTATQPRPSRVQVEVTDVKAGQEFVVRDNNGKPVHIGHYRSPYSYVAFPLQEKSNAAVRQGVEFTLMLRFPQSERADVTAAVWAWENFGGVGARTRRGFGALRCVAVDGVVVPHPPTARGVLDALVQGFTDHGVHGVAGVWPDLVPNLGHGMHLKVMNLVQDPLIAWQDLINRLKEFRQARYGFRGRSKWPEPDEIRHLTGQSLPAHGSRLSTVDRFPRAAFGLPIIFQFLNSDPADANAEPRKTLLQLPGRDRLASPLILRPLPCANGQAVGFALVLNEPDLEHHLKSASLQAQEGSGSWSVNTDLTPVQAGTISPLGGKTDVLKAFLDSL